MHTGAWKQPVAGDLLGTHSVRVFLVSVCTSYMNLCITVLNPEDLTRVKNRREVDVGQNSRLIYHIFNTRRSTRFAS